MSEHNACIRSDKGQRMYHLNHDMHAHSYVADVQFGAETWATAKVETKTEDVTDAITHRRAISCLMALQLVGLL